MFVWFVIFGSYSTLAVNLLRTIIGGWSGIESLGTVGAMFFSVPFLFIYAWLNRKDSASKIEMARLKWLAAAIFPSAYIVFWVSVGLYAFFSSGI